MNSTRRGLTSNRSFSVLVDPSRLHVQVHDKSFNAGGTQRGQANLTLEKSREACLVRVLNGDNSAITVILSAVHLVTIACHADHSGQLLVVLRLFRRPS